MAATAARLASSVPDHRHRSGRKSKRSHHPLDINEETLESLTDRGIPSDRPDAEEVPRLRADYSTETPKLRRTTHYTPMAERTPPRRASSTRKPSTTRGSEVTVRDRSEAHSPEHRHRRRRTRAEENIRDPEHAHVYRSNSVLTRLLPLERARSTVTAASHQPRDIRPRKEGLTRTHTEKHKSRHSDDVVTVRRALPTGKGPRAIQQDRLLGAQLRPVKLSLPPSLLHDLERGSSLHHQ
ncbi:MAG: hypothetical protein LQ350_002798 [Teloschistes chrysophthalmus]|nr:MAG: hypothetical protein LQ350_002798 [Niorma chrysophthalma]